MSSTLAGLLLLLASVLFIVGLKRLSSPATARSGNQAAAVGMLIAVVVTLVSTEVLTWGLIAGGVAVGGVIGAVAAVRVPITSMPELVAAFNGFGGGASALVAAAEILTGPAPTETTAVTIVISSAVGAITFTGSFVAFGKLRGLVPGRPLTYPGQMVVDLLLAGVVLASGILVVVDGSTATYIVLAASAGVLGISRVVPIGGADMPVVIALLNSFSGIAAASAGFVIESPALIIGGALVGASGLILTRIMSRAMNRSLADILFGAFGTDETATLEGAEEKPVRATTPEDVAITLGYARSVIVVPGYGLAVAQAQHALREVADLLEQRSVDVRYAIHPVAGRMPGHMNVLLAEADVSYDQLVEMDEINRDFPHTDVALVVGANDVVNPSARDDATSPIYGMPILEVDRANTVVVVKRSLSPGFAGIDNPLFYRDNTVMLFADAKEGLGQVGAGVRNL
ncbi:MAG: NAD(P)(+) transhydrogenase (Re/Si-specific) subunit beta [Acidimicrobiia bacterium]